jgi:GNAT superfamily N-acetyltransferase
MIVEACTSDDIRLAHNLDDLLVEYALEARMPEMPWPRVDWLTYQLMERAGTLNVFSAREDGELVGFVVLIVTMMPEYGVKLACTEAFFVAKAWRHTGAGLKLLAAAEARARELKAPGLAVSAPLGGKLAEVLPKCGFRHVGQTFFKSYASHGEALPVRGKADA